MEYSAEQIKQLSQRWIGPDRDKERKDIYMILRSGPNWYKSKEYKGLLKSLGPLPPDVEAVERDLRALFLGISYSDLTGINLANADLRWANLRFQKLTRAELSGTDLRWANLLGVDLRRANLSGADLRFANLSHANLRGANLRKAVLKGTKLIETNLTEADLTDTDISEVNIETTYLPEQPPPRFARRTPLEILDDETIEGLTKLLSVVDDPILSLVIRHAIWGTRDKYAQHGAESHFDLAVDLMGASEILKNSPECMEFWLKLSEDMEQGFYQITGHAPFRFDVELIRLAAAAITLEVSDQERRKHLASLAINIIVIGTTWEQWLSNHQKITIKELAKESAIDERLLRNRIRRAEQRGELEGILQRKGRIILIEREAGLKIAGMPDSRGRPKKRCVNTLFSP